MYNLFMDIAITETAKRLMEIEKAFKKAESEWRSSRTGKEKSSHWIEMHKLDGIRSILLIKRQKEIEEDSASPVELSDGSTIRKLEFMNYQKQYQLDDEELKSYIPLINIEANDLPFEDVYANI